MRRILSSSLVTAALALAFAAPSQAAPSLSSTLLDFGTFSAAAPPSERIGATLTVPAGPPTRYFAGLRMLSGQAYFFPSSDCPEATLISSPCQVYARVVTPLTATGALNGVIAVDFAETQAERPPIVETLQLPVTAVVTAAPPTKPQSPSTHKPKKSHKSAGCKKKGKKGHSCGGKKGKGNKGKSHGGKHKAKGHK